MNKYKECRNCKIWKIRSSFHTSNANKDKLASYCKPCGNLKGKNWKSGSVIYKKWQKEYRLIRYGLTAEEYQTLFKKQNKTCAICGIFRLRGRDKVLYIDHDHSTGKVRGLLCYICNTTLGKYEIWKNEINIYLQKEL